MDKVIIEAKNIDYQFQDGEEMHHLFDQCSFLLKENTKVAIIGSSGSGKTSLLHLLSGLTHPHDGQVLYRGRDWQDIKMAEMNTIRAQELGFVYQNQYFLDELTVLENVMLPLQISGVQSAKKHAVEILEKLDISPNKQSLYPNVLSGGQASRVGIARALVNQPSVLFADEPTSALDHQLTEKVFYYINQLYENKPFAMVVATHDHSLLNQFDHVYHLTDGRLEEIKDA